MAVFEIKQSGSFDDFCDLTDKLYRGIEPFKSKVKTFHLVRNNLGTLKYLIHVFKTQYNRLSRDKVGINCGVLIPLTDKVAFVRIFSFPCKFIIIVSKLNLSNFNYIYYYL